jgi:hypothetical protein
MIHTEGSPSIVISCILDILAKSDALARFGEKQHLAKVKIELVLKGNAHITRGHHIPQEIA